MSNFEMNLIIMMIVVVFYHVIKAMIKNADKTERELKKLRKIKSDLSKEEYLNITKKYHAMTKNLYLYEFPTVVKKRVMEEQNWDESKFLRAELYLKDFFQVIKNKKEARDFENLVEMVDDEADELWHTFLLDTKAYKDFCDEYIGSFLHHVPYIERKEVDIKALKKVYKKYLVFNLEEERNERIDYNCNFFYSNIINAERRVYYREKEYEEARKRTEEVYFGGGSDDSSVDGGGGSCGGGCGGCGGG